MESGDLIINLSGQLLGSVLEHNAKIKQTNEISNRIKNYIDQLGTEIKSYILEHSLNQYQGSIDSYHDQYSEIIIKHLQGVNDTAVTSNELNELNHKIDEVTKQINRVYENDINFYTKYVHPVLVSAITLQIAIYSELTNRCGDHTGQLFIRDTMDDLLEKTNKYYKHTFEISKNHNGLYMDYNLHSQFEKYKKIIKERKLLEHQRYLQHINLNGNFKFREMDEVPPYGHFVFDRCVNKVIKNVEDKVSILAVHNKEGQFTNPSIFKDVLDISAMSLSTFRVILKSPTPNRIVQLAIHELAEGEQVHVESKDITLGEEWEEHEILIEKQRNNTFLRYEIYWFDQTENELFIEHTYVDFTQFESISPNVEYSKSLPLPDYYSLENRATNKEVFFQINSAYSTSMYYGINDTNKLFDKPSVFCDLVMMWASAWKDLDVAFGVYLKTREDIGREVDLCIHELYPLGGGAYDIKNSVWSPTYKLTNEWKYFSLTCIRQHHTHVRCEIYWSDHNEVDLMLRDLRVTYTLK